MQDNIRLRAHTHNCGDLLFQMVTPVPFVGLEPSYVERSQPSPALAHWITDPCGFELAPRRSDYTKQGSVDRLKWQTSSSATVDMQRFVHHNATSSADRPCTDPQTALSIMAWKSTATSQVPRSEDEPEAKQRVKRRALVAKWLKSQTLIKQQEGLTKAGRIWPWWIYSIAIGNQRPHSTTTFLWEMAESWLKG